ncbi:MAG: hypothetical protein HZB15_07295 [Actinobacteria bacterium]|nr:hypothetical protein [Actinomycetota bacterium]
MNVRDVSIASDDTREVVARPVRPAAYAAPAGQVVTAPTAVVTEVPPHEVVAVRTSMSVSPAAVVAGIAAVALMLFGAINLARAGLDSPLRDPVVEVAGFEGTAVLGMIALGAGILLLGSAFSRDRGAIMFVSIIIGVAATTVAIEPNVGGGTISTEAAFGVAVAIMAAVVAVVSALAPTMRRTSDRIERI